MYTYIWVTYDRNKLLRIYIVFKYLIIVIFILFYNLYTIYYGIIVFMILYILW